MGARIAERRSWRRVRTRASERPDHRHGTVRQSCRTGKNHAESQVTEMTQFLVGRFGL